MSQRGLLVLFGDQLFDHGLFPERPGTVLMVEDEALCRRYAFHKLKLAFVLSAMRGHADALRSAGLEVRYHTLDDGMSWRRALEEVIRERQPARLWHFEVESAALRQELNEAAEQARVRRECWRTPKFLNPLDDFDEFLGSHDPPRMAAYYQWQRRRHDILMDDDGSPTGGRWSFDGSNRERLPKGLEPQAPCRPRGSAHVESVKALVGERFARHPGSLDHFWLPTTSGEANDWLEQFLERRLHDFGRYEDALTRRTDFVFHSGLSPLLNVGLLTPQHVVERILEYGRAHRVPLNSTEGIVRQIIGWREFVRGVHHRFGASMRSRNVWGAERRLAPSWYRGETGIEPLDHVIGKTGRLGWAHHIERLMVAANLMNLAGIRPPDVYRWFMEMYVDAYDWVMVPNVFGMGLTSDGGIFSTKPYICASNYVLKMGDFPRGDWCAVMDGLFWRFVARNQAALKKNPRLAAMAANLPRVTRRRPEIFTLAEAFIERHTEPA